FLCDGVNRVVALRGRVRTGRAQPQIRIRGVRLVLRWGWRDEGRPENLGRCSRKYQCRGDGIVPGPTKFVTFSPKYVTKVCKVSEGSGRGNHPCQRKWPQPRTVTRIGGSRKQMGSLEPLQVGGRLR